MCVLVTRTGRYREYVWKDRNLPPRVKVPQPPGTDLTAEAPNATTTLREAEFYKIGLTDCYGRPIYVQRW